MMVAVTTNDGRDEVGVCENFTTFDAHLLLPILILSDTFPE